MIDYKKVKTICVILILSSFSNVFADKTNKIYYRIADKKVNLRAMPDLKSNILTQLNYGDRVEIVKTRNENVTIDNKIGKWVFVNTFKYGRDCEGSCKGWVFDYFIAYDQKYEKVKRWNIKDYKNCVADYCPNYTFNKDGSFVLKIQLGLGSDSSENDKIEFCKKSGGIYDKRGFCQYNGQLYKYLNLIWAKIENYHGIQNYLYITKKGSICMPESECKDDN